MHRMGVVAGAFVVAGVAACSSGLLNELTTSPTGYPVLLSTTFTPGVVATSGAITGKGDSVVALVTRPAVCGRTQSADAGLAAGELVITITLTAQGVQNCLPLNGMTTYRAVVHGVSGGLVTASAHVRISSNGANSDTTVVQSTFTLP